MKGWVLLLMGLGACEPPPRRPPVTYVPIVRSPEAPPPTLPDPAPVPLGQDPPSTPTPVTTKAATSEKPTPGNDPVNDEKCFRKVEGNCCAEPGYKAKKQGSRTACPAGMQLGKNCKGIGRSCHP